MLTSNYPRKGAENLEEITIGFNENLSVGEGAFTGTPAHITLSDGFTNVPSNMFNNCNMTKGISLPNTIISIGDNAFNGFNVTNSITLPANLSTLGTNAFKTCRADIVFASGMTTIPYSILVNSYVKHITIPSTVTKISNDAFKNCYYLIDITFDGTKVQWENVTKSSNWNQGTGTVTVKCTDGDLEIDG